MVGSNLIQKFIYNKKNIVIAIDNLILGKKKFIKNYLRNKNFFFYKKNLDEDFLDLKIQKILKKGVLSEIWLLAANSDIQKGVRDKNIDFKNTYLTNFKTLNQLNKYTNMKTKIIFSSSSAIYGNYKGIISENLNRFNPISNYGKMKLLSEKFILTFCKINKFKGYIFRFPNVVGKNLTHGIIFDLNKKLKMKNKYLKVLGNGYQQKPYSDVMEIINCMVFIKNKKFNNLVNYFNIGTNDRGIRVKKIVEILIKIKKSKKIPTYQNKSAGWKGDVPKYRYSTKKIHNLGFKFKLSSEDSIQNAIKLVK